jgi:hypothetical protein
VELTAAAVAAAAATTVNPYGIALWSFLRETVGLGRPDITEWHPIATAGPGVAAFWCVSAVIAAVLLRRSPRAAPAESFPVVMMGALAFRVSRLDAFFAISVAVLLAPQLAALWSNAREPDPRRAVPRRAVMAALVLACAIRWPSLTRLDLDSAAWLPERQAVVFMKACAIRGNMVTFFDWGEYAIWHLAPEVKVSMDGRRETVYSAAPIAGHLAVYRNQREGIEYLRRLNPDYVWLPKSLAIVDTLRTSGEWAVVFDGSTSAVLARHTLVAYAPANIDDSRARFFPGP